MNAGNLLVLKKNRNTALGKGNSLHSSQWALADTNRWLLRKQASQRCPGLTEMTTVCSTSCCAMPCALTLKFSMLDQWVVKQTFHSNTLWCTITTKLEANASLSQGSNSRKKIKKKVYNTNNTNSFICIYLYLISSFQNNYSYIPDGLQWPYYEKHLKLPGNSSKFSPFQTQAIQTQAF